MGRAKTGTVIWRGDVPYARVQWADENGKRRQKEKRADNKSHADRLIKDMLRELDDHGAKSLEANRMTFAELAEHYDKHHAIPAKYVDDRKVEGLRSIANVKAILNTLKIYFGKKRLRDITYGDIARFKSDRLATPTKYGKPRSVTTVHRDLAVLRNMLNVAFRESWILKNPFMSGPPLINSSYERKRERILTLEEEDRLVAACIGKKSHIKPIVVCGLDTGMRRGEIIKLIWADVDFDTKLIRVIAFNTKTGQERWLALTPRLEEELLSLYEKSTQDPSALVFGIKDSFKKAFMSARKSAGLPDVRFHDLRHTFASRAVKQHVPLATVGKTLGHTQPRTTWRYVNNDVETAREVATAIATLRLVKNDEETATIIQ
jgi:integrase